MIVIESYTTDRARTLADLFHRSVHAIDPKFYSTEEKEAWAPTPPDYRYWVTRLARKHPMLAFIDGRIVGFMELAANGHIDCTYVDPDFQGRGVALALYRHIEAIARDRSIKRLHVAASIPASSMRPPAK